MNNEANAVASPNCEDPTNASADTLAKDLDDLFLSKWKCYMRTVKGRKYTVMVLAGHLDTPEIDRMIKARKKPEPKTTKIPVTLPVDPHKILEFAEGMAAFNHGSDGHNRYRAELCKLIGLPADTEIDSMKLTPMPVAPKSVVTQLKEFAILLAQRGLRTDSNCALDIAAKIIELPEKSEWDLNWDEYITRCAKGAINIKPKYGSTISLPKAHALQFARAVVEATEGEAQVE